MAGTKPAKVPLKHIKIVCRNMDRLVTAPLRPLGHPRGDYVPRLYRKARAQAGAPLSYLGARAILDHPGSHIALVTGTYNPKYFPGGETDGPIGAVVFSRVLNQLGYKTTFCVERQIIPAVQGLAKAAGAVGDYEPLEFYHPTGHEHLADKFDGAIFIEKIGVNAKGVPHTSSGMNSDTDDAPVYGLAARMLEQGKFTIGLGDGGNEVGFGNIYDYVRKIVSYGAKCRCPCGDGIATVVKTSVGFPSAISNWAGYSIIAAMALILNDLSLLHTPEKETELLELAPSLGCYEGTIAEPVPSLDSVPVEGSAAMVQLLKSCIEVAYRDILNLATRPY